MNKEYSQGIDTELINFPQTGLKARDIPNQYPTPIAEKLWLQRVRAELRLLRRKNG